jgi:hypothetical protein
MKKVLLSLFVIVSLIGCTTTVPVTAKFPEPPKYNTRCPELKKLNSDAKLSDVATTVTINYSTYYECALRNDAWLEWYQIQKRIFEGVK